MRHDLGPDLTGRVALVAGAGSEIGRAAARALSGRGASIVLTDDDAAAAAQAARQWGQGRDRVVAVSAGTGDPDEVAELFRQAEGSFSQPVDILVMADFAETDGGILDTDVAAWHQGLHANVTSFFLAASEFVRRRRDARRPGAVVAIAAGGTTAGAAGSPASQASAGAVVALARAMAFDHGREGVRVNSVSVNRGPSPSPDLAEQVAETIAFLASDGASFITGTDVVVDGPTGRVVR